MAVSVARRRRIGDAPYWPGFVDAMAQLLLVITFLLSVFIVAQFLLAREISGRDSALGQLRSKIAALSELLAMEKSSKAQLSSLLSDSEQRNVAGQAQIVDLGKRLNSALAQRVQELARYRSEFFGRLRKILSDRPGILVVGDRFVFQSEVLFQKGSADINEPGLVEMGKLGDALRELERDIPGDIAWVLRVDGH